jgi:hypothetical protein
MINNINEKVHIACIVIQQNQVECHQISQYLLKNIAAVRQPHSLICIQFCQMWYFVSRIHSV